MWQLFTGAVRLFFQGRLFADRKQAHRRILLSAAIAAGVSCLLALTGIPIWVATLAGGIAGGGAAPILCINLRMQ